MNVAQARDFLRKKFHDLNTLSTPGGVYGIIHEGQFIAKESFGAANIEHQIPNTPTTKFCLASIAKSFTGMAIALLEESGKLSIEDNLLDHMPHSQDFSSIYQELQLKHLLYHTSGIFDYYYMGYYIMGMKPHDSFTHKTALSLLANQDRLLFSPGKQFQYSNSNYYLLSLVIEQVSGMSLDKFAKRYIFDPLGMKDSHFRSNRSNVMKNRATGYAPYPITNEDPHFAPFSSSSSSHQYYIHDVYSELLGDDGLWTTLDDFLKWDQNFYQNILGEGKPELITRYLAPGHLLSGEPIDYGYGMGLGKFHEWPLFGHNGCNFGFTSVYNQIPSQKFTFLCFCNTNAIYPFEFDTKLMEKAFFNSDQINAMDKSKLQSPTKVIEEGRLAIQAKDSKMVMDWGNDIRKRLEKAHFVVLCDQSTGLTWTITADKTYANVLHIKENNDNSALLKFEEDQISLVNREDCTSCFVKTHPNSPNAYLEVIVEGNRADLFPTTGEMGEDYAGQYFCSNLSTSFNVALIQNKTSPINTARLHSNSMGLKLQNTDFQRNNLNIELFPVFYDHFLHQNPYLWHIYIVFERDSHGKIQGFRFRGSIDDLRTQFFFKRVEKENEK